MCTFYSESSSESSGSEESADEDPGSYSRYRSNSIPTEVNIQPGISFNITHFNSSIESPFQ